MVYNKYMIRRFFTKRKLYPDCNTCYNYHSPTDLCLLYNSPRVTTRLYENKCGVEGKNYVSKIQPNAYYLEKSNEASLQSYYYYIAANLNVYAAVMQYKFENFGLLGLFMLSAQITYFAGIQHSEEANIYKTIHMFQEHGVMPKK